MAVRVLADGHLKFSVLTTKPEDPANPTATELNAGIDASCLVLTENFSWTAADSDRIDEKALCSTTNAEAPGAGNSNLAVTYWRWFDATTGEFDVAADELHEAVKVAGTELWGYLRAMGKPFSEAWADGDEISYGAAFVTDVPQMTGTSGFIKYTLPCLGQDAWPFAEVAAAGTP